MRKIYWVVFALLIVVACQTQLSNQNKSPEQNQVVVQEKTSAAISKSTTTDFSDDLTIQWPLQMQLLTKSYSELLPLLSDPLQFNNPTQKKYVISQLEELKRISHILYVKSPTPDKDPTIKFISERFEQNMLLAADSFQSGHSEFARGVLKNSLSQCVQCHTRLDIGPSLIKSDYLVSLKSITSVERIQFLIASRYFEDAINELNLSLKDSANLSIVAWQKLVQLGLILHVRLHNDLPSTEKFIDILNGHDSVPYFIKRNITYWQKSLKNWKNKNYSKENASLKNAIELIELAEKLQKESKSDGGLIEYLRAAHLLHQFLSTDKPSPIKAQALYELGLTYENVGEIGAWSMNEDYYELCIRVEPHSDTAKKCFARYQESLITGYSGTGGLYLPQDVQKKISELRAIAL